MQCVCVRVWMVGMVYGVCAVCACVCSVRACVCSVCSSGSTCTRMRRQPCGIGFTLLFAMDSRVELKPLGLCGEC